VNTIFVAVLAAMVALIGYLITAAVHRRIEKSQRYAQALDAVERYKQLPNVFRRLHDGTPETRLLLAGKLADSQLAIAYHRRLLTLDSIKLGDAYGALVEKIRLRNSTFRRDALSAPPISNDLDIEVGNAYDFDEKDELLHCLCIMRKRLTILRNLT
jgi:hypothetical protein